MGRKGGSYKFEKRQKEINKQKKRKEKLERRQTKDADDEPLPSDPDRVIGETTDPSDPEGVVGETADQ